MAVLLGLPNEVLLRIFHYLPKSIRHPKPQADLLNLSLTCKRLAPLAREVLFTAPILQLCKIDTFLASLFEYPYLQLKVQSLIVESNKIYRSWVISDPDCLWDPEEEISSRCAGILHTLILDVEVKQEYIQVLQRESGWVGNLISLVLILLPNLSSLYLGGTPLTSLNFLQPVSDRNLDGYRKMSVFDRIHIPPQLSAKLTFLELPSGLQLEKGSVFTLFPELRHLILSCGSFRNFSPRYVIPPKLETLVVTNYEPDLDDWINEVALAQKTSFPSLCSLSLYYEKESYESEYPPLLRDEMKKLGITRKTFLHFYRAIHSAVTHEILLADVRRL
jgi:hypothetical protein